MNSLISLQKARRCDKEGDGYRPHVANTLVIVESPTKARTIRGFLPKGYRVEASMGHVRDLPNNASEIPAAQKGQKWANLGVNTEANFEPLYVVPKDKKKIVRELKDALKALMNCCWQRTKIAKGKASVGTYCSCCHPRCL